MKELTDEQIDEAINSLLDKGKIVIGRIRVVHGDRTTHYASLSTCPAEHREGYRCALKTRSEVTIQDIVYSPVFIAAEYASSIAT